MSRFLSRFLNVYLTGAKTLLGNVIIAGSPLQLNPPATPPYNLIIKLHMLNISPWVQSTIAKVYGLSISKWEKVVACLKRFFSWKVWPVTRQLIDMGTKVPMTSKFAIIINYIIYSPVQRTKIVSKQYWMIEGKINSGIGLNLKI